MADRGSAQAQREKGSSSQNGWAGPASREHSGLPRPRPRGLTDEQKKRLDLSMPRTRDELGLPQGDDGILTAEAIAGLPLEELERAVLSGAGQ